MTNFTSGTTIAVEYEYNFDISAVEFLVTENQVEVNRFDEAEFENAVAFANEIAEYGDQVVNNVPGWVHVDIETTARFNKWADDLAEQMGGGFVLTENGVQPLSSWAS